MDMNRIKNDIFGGITAGIVALPLALAFGVQSGMGAISGLYGAIALGLIATIFGGTATQVSGPTGPMTVVSSMVIAKAIEVTGGLSEGMGMIIVTFFLAGLLQMGLGFLRIGKYVKYIPYPVISGFMSGIGVIIILFQIFPLLGYDSPRTTLDVFSELINVLPIIKYQAVIFGVATILMVYGVPYLTRAVPSSIIALIILTGICVYIGSDIPSIGDIPSGIPSIQWDHLMTFSKWRYQDLFIPAFTLAALGAIDSLLTSIIADNITRTKHDSNRELVGQGLGNMVSAMIGGIPGAGATMRTVVNVSSGGRTRLSGVTHSILLLIILLGAGPYAAQIPKAVLAGILLTVGISIIDYRGLKNIRNLPRSDVIVMLVVLLLTIFVDLLQAVFVGMVLASLLFMKAMGDVAERETQVGHADDFTELMSLENTKLPAKIGKNIYVKNLYGPLFFGFTSHFQDLVNAVPDVKMVIIGMEQVPFIDQSGIFTFEESFEYLRSRGIKMKIVGLQEQPLRVMRYTKTIPDLLSEEAIFEDWASLINWLNQNHSK